VLIDTNLGKMDACFRILVPSFNLHDEGGEGGATFDFNSTSTSTTDTFFDVVSEKVRGLCIYLYIFKHVYLYINTYIYIYIYIYIL
jgi:hypothetical protein